MQHRGVVWRSSHQTLSSISGANKGIPIWLPIRPHAAIPDSACNGRLAVTALCATADAVWMPRKRCLNLRIGRDITRGPIVKASIGISISRSSTRSSHPFRHPEDTGYCESRNVLLSSQATAAFYGPCSRRIPVHRGRRLGTEKQDQPISLTPMDQRPWSASHHISIPIHPTQIPNRITIHGPPGITPNNTCI